MNYELVKCNRSLVVWAKASMFLTRKSTGLSNHGDSETAPTRPVVRTSCTGLNAGTAILSVMAKRKFTGRSSALLTVGNYNHLARFIKGMRQSKWLNILVVLFACAASFYDERGFASRVSTR